MARKLQRFIDGTADRSWIYMRWVSLYARKSRRIFGGVRYDLVFDISSVEVKHYRQGSGVFKNLLADILMETAGKFDAIYVENVINPKFAAFFEREGSGWIRTNPDEGYPYPPSYYMLLRGSNAV